MAVYVKSIENFLTCFKAKFVTCVLLLAEMQNWPTEKDAMHILSMQLLVIDDARFT